MKNQGPKPHAPIAPASTDAEAGLRAGQPEGTTAAVSTHNPGALGVEAGQLTAAEIQHAQEQYDREQAALIVMREQLRAETPLQVVKVRPEPKSPLLGMVLRAQDGKLRTSRMVDWRTEELTLRAGDHVIILVLVGEDLEHFESFERQALEQKAAAANVEG